MSHPTHAPAVQPSTGTTQSTFSATQVPSHAPPFSFLLSDSELGLADPNFSADYRRRDSPWSFFDSPTDLDISTFPRLSPPPAQPPAPTMPRRTAHIDLTSPQMTPHRRRSSPASGPSAKRQRRVEEPAATLPPPVLSAQPSVDEVDLTDDHASVNEVLRKQRADAVAAQAPQEESRTTFNTFTCVICMDNPTDLTATACGHIFCHTCLHEALIAGENRTGPGEPKRSQCPVCRKTINRAKASDVIPLLLMKGAATQPRKRVGGDAAGGGGGAGSKEEAEGKDKWKV